MGIDNDFDDFHHELVDVASDLVRLASRHQQLQARDDIKLAALLNRAHVLLERLTDSSTLKEIRLQ
jgi:hypothetical protein